MSETTNLKLFKHDNILTNTNLFDIDKSLNQNWDKIDGKVGNLDLKNNNMQQQINSLASGSPKGSYATISALISANPENGVYLVQADGHIYSWTKGEKSPIDLGVYQAREIEDGSITPTKTNFIFPFINLYDNEKEVEHSTYINQNDGEPGTYNPQYWFTTDFIQVIPNKLYSTCYNFIVNYYDVNKNWISGSNGSISKNTFTVPNDTSIVFCRLSLNNRYFGSAFLYEGSYTGNIATEYNTTNLENFVKVNSNNLTNYLKSIINDNFIDVSLSTQTESTNKSIACDFSIAFDIPSDTNKIFISYDIDTDFYTNQFKHTFFGAFNKELGNGSYSSVLTNYYGSNHVEISIDDIPENTKAIKCNSYFNSLNTNTEYNFKIKNVLIIINDNFLLDNSQIIVGPFWEYSMQNFTTSFDNKYFKNYNFYTDNDNHNDTNNDTNIDKNIVIMGDSITWLKEEKSWINYMKEKVNFKNITNLALSGARWANKSNTQYDIVNKPTSATSNNVIWNQFNTLKDMTDKNTINPPDVILILAGTNDQWIDNAKFYGDVNTAFSGSIIDKEVTEILTVAESIRYNCELILQEYPDCQIILATMLQRGISNQSTIYSLNELVKECANRLSIDVIDQTYKSGIYGYNEINSHKYLYDGTHPNEEGAKRIGYFIANELKNKIF